MAQNDTAKTVEEKLDEMDIDWSYSENSDGIHFRFDGGMQICRIVKHSDWYTSYISERPTGTFVVIREE